MKIRLRDSGEIVIDGEFRARHPDTSFPAVLTSEILDAFGADEVIETAQPSVGADQYVAFAGAEQVDGAWFAIYEARDYTTDQLQERLEKKRRGMIISPFQAKAALFNAGLLDDVEALILAPETPTLVKLAWVNTTEFRRTSTMITQLAAALNITDEQLDELFIAASAIVA